jgi:hypothetical protein
MVIAFIPRCVELRHGPTMQEHMEMSMNRVVSTFGASMFVTLGAVSLGSAANFNQVVETVLSRQPRITELSPDRRRAMVACVKQVLKAVPPAQQRYVEASANYDEMQDRFGEIVLADRAKFKQKITQQCGGIVASQ